MSSKEEIQERADEYVGPFVSPFETLREELTPHLPSPADAFASEEEASMDKSSCILQDSAGEDVEDVRRGQTPVRLILTMIAC